jgi:hypothetical protein
MKYPSLSIMMIRCTNLIYKLPKAINFNNINRFYSSTINYNAIKNINNINQLNISIINKFSRLYVNSNLIIGDKIQLDEASSHYISNVIRIKTDQYFRIFNGKDGEFLCQINNITKKTTKIEIIKQLKTMKHDSAITLPITLYIAPIKKPKMKLIFEKATELGICNIVPIITQNTNSIIENKDEMVLKLHILILFLISIVLYLINLLLLLL